MEHLVNARVQVSGDAALDLVSWVNCSPHRGLMKCDETIPSPNIKSLSFYIDTNMYISADPSQLAGGARPRRSVVA